MSKNHKLTDSDYYEFDYLSEIPQSNFIYHHVFNIKQKLRSLNNNRLGHFDGAFANGIYAGYAGKKETDCPYKYTYNEYYGGYTWSDEWSYQWHKGWKIGVNIRKKETEWRSQKNNS